jgi:hypothetical protein
MGADCSPLPTLADEDVHDVPATPPLPPRVAQSRRVARPDDCRRPIDPNAHMVETMLKVARATGLKIR